jgi:TPR repeat protein
MKRLALFIALIFAFPMPAAAGFYEGLQAYSAGDYATALKEWRPLAEQGDAGAQFNLGVMYSQGRGVPQDYAEAVKWYRLAAEQGYASAQFNLGLMFDFGQGVPQNEAEAAKWYRLAAEQCNASAQYNLGLMYKRGQGVPQNEAEAAKWYRLAAEQGYASAQYNLGLMYYQGQGVPQDYVEAHMWWNLAAAAGQKNAAKNRDIIARQMTPSQIAEAQRLAKGGKVGEPVTGWAALSRNDIKAVQRALNAAGYDAGPADGIRGKRTETALAAYQRHKGLPVGSPESETLKALGLR